ncbi:MAG: type II secretion system protein [Gemmatimonadales bacterium]|nr:type II secretion system protein [Gemmatimonadales bacterium]
MASCGRIRRARAARAGVSLVELMIVLVVVGIMAAVATPRLRLSPRQRVSAAALALAADLEAARTRALAARRHVRLTFDEPGGTYSGFMDTDGDSVFSLSAAEQDTLRTPKNRRLENGVEFGRGVAPAAPGDTGSTGAIVLDSLRLDIDSRGLPRPFGTRGVIYLRHPGDPTAVAAVTIRGGGAIRPWMYQANGTWR